MSISTRRIQTIWLLTALAIALVGCESSVDFQGGGADAVVTEPDAENPLVGDDATSPPADCDALDCNDGNPCTDDSCDQVAGCVNEVNTAGCDDGDPCTVGDTCADGACGAGTEALSCDDENPCTDDSCDGSVEGGCVNAPNTAECDDGDPCTVGDTCGEGACGAGTEALSCDDENPCTDDSCDGSVEGGCVNANNTAGCDDGNACTVGDTCGEGTCGEGTEALSCDDENDCTEDSCDPATAGGCVHDDKFDGVACDDGDLCTEITECQSGTCVSIGDLNCDDKSDCTVDGCDHEKGGCFHLNGANGKICDDDDACTTDTVCAEGVCAGGEAVVCDNGLFCDGVETCDPAAGCQTADVPVLDDGVGCTVDNCDEDVDEITHTVDHSLCDNDLFCDGVEFCDLTDDCQQGQAPVVDDGVECTADHCDEENDVVTHVTEHSKCDNGAFCDGAEICNAVEGCQNGEAPEIDDGIPCTVDVCDETLGQVTHQANDDACDEDGNVCTDTVCSLTDGCVQHILEGATCDDGDPCSVGDLCTETAQCRGEDLCQSSDENPCVSQECLSSNGAAWCENVINPGQICPTGDPCTKDGACNATGQCVGDPLCDDQNPCTEDLCADGICGGTTALSGMACEPDNQCAAAAICNAGECVTATAKNCNDDNSCTADFCDVDEGCVYEAADPGSPCSDGDPCTMGDGCGEDGCTPGPDVAYRSVLEDWDTTVVEALEGWEGVEVVTMTASYNANFTIRTLNSLGNVMETRHFTPESHPLLGQYSKLSGYRMVKHPEEGILITGSVGAPTADWDGQGQEAMSWRRMVMHVGEDLNMKWFWVNPDKESHHSLNYTAVRVMPGGEIFTAGACLLVNNGPFQPCYELINPYGTSLLAAEGITIWGDDNHGGQVYDAIYLPEDTLDGKGAGLLLTGSAEWADADWKWGHKALIIRLVMPEWDPTGLPCTVSTCALSWEVGDGGYVKTGRYITTNPGQGPVPAWDTAASAVFRHTGGPSTQGVFVLIGQVAVEYGAAKHPWLAHINGNGEIAWQEIYPTGGLNTLVNWGVLEPQGNGLLMVGQAELSSQTAYHYAGLLLRVDLNSGEMAWSKALGLNKNESYERIALMETGGYVIGGYSETQVGQGDDVWSMPVPVITRLGQGANTCDVVTPHPELGGYF